MGKTTKDRPLIVGVRDTLISRFPQYKPQIEAVAPYVISAADAIDASFPYVVTAYRACKSAYDKVQRNHWDDYAPLIFGLVMCFFGGTYMTLIAAFEAVRLSVWSRLHASLCVLHDNYTKAMEASRKDDAIDDDKNGTPDVLEASGKQLLSRKVAVVMRATDPDQVSTAAANFWGGILVVVATVKTQFAQALTLGASLGEILDGHFHQPVESFALSVLPVDQRKWAGTLTLWAFKLSGSLVALLLRRVIVAIHAAIRGAKMFTEAAVRLAQKHNALPQEIDASSRQVTVVAGLIAFWGFYWQLTHAFGLPLPLSILLLPLTLIEWLLEVFISVL